jgi:segregation and condensation protein B
MNKQLSDHLEALLFYKGEPISVRELGRMAGAGEEEVRMALTVLGERLIGGIRLVMDDHNALLATAPEYAASIETLIKEELSKDIGKAGAETLATVLYMGPLTRARIDHIRGVNSTFILRNLAARGLVEKTPNPDDSRSMLYRPTLALLAYLGVSSVTELPRYVDIRGSVVSFERNTMVSAQEKGDDTAPIFLDEDKEMVHPDIEDEYSEQNGVNFYEEEIV